MTFDGRINPLPRRSARAARRGRSAIAAPTFAIVALASTAMLAAAQFPQPTPESEARRLNERIRALQSEAADLAKESTTLVGELRKLEIERDLRREEARQAERAVEDANRMLQDATARLESLQQQRATQLPDLETQLVDLYKRGRTRYARLLFGAESIRDFARATRAVAALAELDGRRVAEHRRTVEALQQERDRLEQTTQQLASRQAAARRARGSAERAVKAHAELIAGIESRRDVNARYNRELQQAYDRLQERVADLAANGAARPDDAAAPLSPLRGDLPWPASGDVTGRFGQASGRLGGTAVRNGIEIAAPEDSPVRAVHGGTVGFAGPFTGFGTLVIVDHGANNYSLYGYLGSTAVQQDQRVEAGAELGRVGRAPAGPPALYFEMRIDGRSVDPLQWLEGR